MDAKFEFIGPMTLVGKAGRGAAGAGAGWILALWKELSEGFAQIGPLAQPAVDGRPLCLWGAMRRDESFAPWENGEGEYLAGCQLSQRLTEEHVPEGWDCWHLPQMLCLVVHCRQEEMAQATDLALGYYFPKEELRLEGAIQERYPAGISEGTVELCFPVKIER